MPILSQINPVNSSPTPLPEDRNFILPSTPGSCKWSFPPRFPKQNPVCFSHQYVLHAPPIFVLLDSIAQTIFGEEYRSLSSSLCSFLHSPLSYVFPPMPKYSPQQPILKHPRPSFLPQCQQPSFTRVQNSRQNYISVYLNLYIFGSKLKNKAFCTE